MTDDARSSDRVLGSRYRLEAVVARGGMAEVWTAHDVTLDRRVAVKILHPALTTDAASTERFRREARAAAQMTHPNIVTLYDTGEDDGTVYLVMEYVEGVTLRRLIDNEGPLGLERAIGLTVQIADALEESHRRGFVHRDIKPANVLIDTNGRAKVTDFGIAKLVGDSGDLTRTGVVVGTARYLSPEQLSGAETDHRTDVYSLALLTYEMLAGKPAFGGDTDISSAVSRMTTDPQPLSGIRSDVSDDVVAAIARGLEREPSQRWATIAAYADALRTENVGDVPPPDATTDRGSAPRRVRSVEGAAAAAQRDRRAQQDRRDPSASFPTAIPVDDTGTSALTPSPARPPTNEPTRRTRRVRRGVTAALIVAAIVAAAVVIGIWQFSGGGDGDPGTLTIVGASDFDPPPGDESEHPDRAIEAIDGDVDTGWTTETYLDRAFGPKDGVGLRVDLDGVYDVSWVRVETDLAGWSGAIYLSEAPGRDLASWNGPLVSGSDLETAVRFRVDPPTRGSSVLIWITQLPEGGRLMIRDVQVG